MYVHLYLCVSACMYIHASIYLPTLFIYVHISAVTIEIIHRERFLHLPPNVFKRGIYSDTARCLFRIGVDDLYVNINNTDMIYGGGNSGVLKLRAVTIVDTRLIRYEIQHTYIYVYIHICIHTCLLIHVFTSPWVRMYIHDSQYYAVRELVSCVSPTGNNNGDNNFLTVVYHENFTTSAASSKVHISIHTCVHTPYI